MSRFAGDARLSRTISAATTNATVVKAAPAQLVGWSLSNVNAAVRYLKLYNKATAPTVGTDVPLLTISLPLGGVPVTNVFDDAGIGFSAGLSFALTTGLADADTAAVAASEIIVQIFYR